MHELGGQVNEYLLELFNDAKIIARIRGRLPYLFQLAELENSRAGRIGMGVGSVRERVITALLIYTSTEKKMLCHICQLENLKLMLNYTINPSPLKPNPAMIFLE